MSFCELLCRTNFSFLEGASHAHEIAKEAAALEIPAIGVADSGTLAGIVRAHQGAEEHGIKLLIGARVKVEGLPEVALYAPDRAAYGRLSRLLTLGKRRAPKSQCWLLPEDLDAFSEGLLAIAVPSLSAIRDRFDQSLQGVETLRDIYGDRLSLALVRHLGDHDSRDMALQGDFLRASGLPGIASNDVHYHRPERQPLQDVLTCIRHGAKIDEAGRLLFANAERYLKSEAQMRVLFRGYEDCVERTQAIADQCRFRLTELRYEYPDEIVPQGMTIQQHLAAETWKGAARRYPMGVPTKVSELVERELALIAELSYESYFLTVYDIVAFARSKGILCQGRGSAANSAVCYCLGVTSVDPAHHDLLFERFVSKERNEPPDIDIDFENARREEVMQYIYAKYGRHRAGLTCTVITYRRKSALREIAKVFGLSLDQQDALTKYVDSLMDQQKLEGRLKEAGLNPQDRRVQLIMRLARQLRGFPRHLSQHVGGFVITRGRLDEMVPIENAAMEDRTVIEWDKDDIEELGILKVDCLALGMLTAIQKCFVLLENHHGHRMDLAGVLATDGEFSRDGAMLPPEGCRAEGVYDMICAADCIGVFQIESRAQLQMLPRLRPRSFYDLVIEVAIIRPWANSGRHGSSLPQAT